MKEMRGLGIGTLTADLVADEAGFLRLEHEWNDAVDRAAIAHPFLRHEWVRTWWEAFGADSQLHILVVRAGGEIAAIAPLMRERAVMYGLPVRRLRFIQNDHTPRTDVIVASHRSDSYRALWSALRDCRGEWDVLLFSQLEHASPAGPAFGELAAADGHPTGIWKSNDSPYITLTGTWDAYLESLAAKFRANLRNRMSRLTRLGEPSLEVLTDAASIKAACADTWRIEASGWKRDAGTAIASDASVERFYTALIDRGAAAGWLQLLFLTVGGRRIATSYGACFGSRLFLFKTGYDPEYATCAPFKLLTYLAVREAYARGLIEVDFLGDAEPWKLEWTDDARGHDWLFVFGTSVRARLVHSIKFEWLPEVKRWRA